MQHTQQSSNARRNILVGLTMGAGTMATGCDVPQPASLENSGMAGLDYASLDYNKLDYSKLDYSQLDPEQMGEFGCVKETPAKVLSEEMKNRLFVAHERAQEQKLGEQVVGQIEQTIVSIHQADQLFAEFQDLCW